MFLTPQQSGVLPIIGQMKLLHKAELDMASKLNVQLDAKCSVEIAIHFAFFCINDTDSVVAMD